MQRAIVLFAKSPVPGQVKTRLQSLLSADQAARFQEACIRDSWAKLGVLKATRHLYLDQRCESIDRLVGPEARGRQRGANLGERMFNCLHELHRQGYERVLILGSDSPSLPVEYLRQGIEALDASDVVLGPTADGGYYAIGCRNPHERMFNGVRWSTAETFRDTEAALAALGLRPRLLPPWYDVDTPEDLRRLVREPELPANIAQWLERLPDELRGVLSG